MKSKIAKYCGVLFCLALLCSTIAYAASDEYHKPSTLFAHEDIQIEPHQVIYRLLVADGNAVVSGVIQQGIVIVDGNLIITPEARIQGSVVVLGGEVERQPGAEPGGHLLNIKPQHFPMMNLVIGSLSLVAVLSLLVLPCMVWLVRLVCRRLPCCEFLKNGLLEIQHHRPVVYLVLTLGLSCSMLVMFAELAWQTIFRHTMDMFDNVIIWLVRYFANPMLDQIMIFISNLGYGYVYGFIVVIAFSILAYYRRWLEFAGLVISLAGGAVLNNLLKMLFERARPDEFRLVAAAGFSFPSGHAMGVIYFYGMVVFLIARRIKSWRRRYVLTAATILFIAAMGISRIYLGVHYPSDIVAGYTAGGMWLMFSISLMMLWERKAR